MLVVTMFIIFAGVSASADMTVSPSDLLAVARYSFENKKYGDCLKVGQMAKAADPKLALADIIMGRCEERLGNFSKAHSHFKSATRSDPTNADAWNNRVLMSIKDVRTSRAKQELRTFVSIAPNDERIAILTTLIRDLEDVQKTESLPNSKFRRLIKASYKKENGK